MNCTNAALPAYASVFLAIHITFPNEPLMVTVDADAHSAPLVFNSSNANLVYGVGNHWRVSVTRESMYANGTLLGYRVRVHESNGYRTRESIHYAASADDACRVLGYSTAPNAPLQTTLAQTYPVDVLLQGPIALGAVLDNRLYKLCPILHDAPNGVVTYGGAFNVSVTTSVVSGNPVSRLSSITQGPHTVTYTEDNRPIVTYYPRPPRTTPRMDNSELAAHLATIDARMGAWMFNLTLTLYPVFGTKGRYGMLDNTMCGSPIYNGDTTSDLGHTIDQAVGNIVIWSSSGKSIYYQSTKIGECESPHLTYSYCPALICVEEHRVLVYKLTTTMVPYTNWTYDGNYSDDWWVFVNDGDCDTAWFIFGVLDNDLMLYQDGQDPVTYLSSVDVVWMNRRNNVELVSGVCTTVCTVNILSQDTLNTNIGAFTTLYSDVPVPVSRLRGALIAYTAADGDPDLNDNPAFEYNKGSGGVLVIVSEGQVHRGYIDDTYNIWSPPYSANIERIFVYLQYIALSGPITYWHDAGSVVIPNTTSVSLCEGGVETYTRQVGYEIGGSHVYSSQYTNHKGKLVGFTYNATSGRYARVWADGTYSPGIAYGTGNSSSLTRLHIMYGTLWDVSPDTYVNPYIPSTVQPCTATEDADCALIDVPIIDDQAAWNVSSFCKSPYAWSTERLCSLSYPNNRPLAILILYMNAVPWMDSNCTDLSTSAYVRYDSPPITKANFGGVFVPVNRSTRQIYTAPPPPVLPLTTCPATSYQTKAPTTTTDRVCKPITQCASTEHITLHATATSDHVCRAKVLACVEGQYLNASANNDNATTDRCLDCPPGTTTYHPSCSGGPCPAYHTNTSCSSEPYECPTNQYLTAGAGHPSKLCKPCTSCASVQVECTTTTDRVCSTPSTGINTCPVNTYRNDGVGPEGECQPCKLCALTRSECTPTVDRICYPFSREKYYADVGLGLFGVRLAQMVWFYSRG